MTVSLNLIKDKTAKQTKTPANLTTPLTNPSTEGRFQMMRLGLGSVKLSSFIRVYSHNVTAVPYRHARRDTCRNPNVKTKHTQVTDSYVFPFCVQ